MLKLNITQDHIDAANKGGYRPETCPTSQCLKEMFPEYNYIRTWGTGKIILGKNFEDSRLVDIHKKYWQSETLETQITNYDLTGVFVPGEYEIYELG